jgi:hypothetical protein
VASVCSAGGDDEVGPAGVVVDVGMLVFARIRDKVVFPFSLDVPCVKCNITAYEWRVPRSH